MMKKFCSFLLVACLAIAAKTHAQCPLDVNVDNIVRPTCGLNNGSFRVQVRDAGSGQTIEVSIDNGTSYTSDGTSGAVNFSGLASNVYHIKVRNAATPGVICQSFDFILRSDYINAGGFNLSQSPATGCHNADGSITLSGHLSTDSVCWISSYNLAFVEASTLSGGNTINNLIPGLYYVTIKSAGASPYCYTIDTITVQNTGTACPAASFCATATDPSNLFPNGSFGSGGNADGTAADKQGGTLPVGQTGYQYQLLGPYGPEDGFYTLANNSYIGAPYEPYTSYNNGNPYYTPFDGNWYDGYDHDYQVTGVKNGYMMIVNADVDPNIVFEDTIYNLCTGKTYQFSAWVKSLTPPGGGNIAPNETFLVDGIGLYNTGDINSTNANDWHQVGFTFVASGPTCVFSLRNNAPGGQGNDFAIDDIYLGSCVPVVSATPLDGSVCSATPPVLNNALVTDAADLYSYYQWEVDKNDGNGYVSVGGVQNGTFVSHQYNASVTLPDPVTDAAGWSYRLTAGTSPGELSSAGCFFVSDDPVVVPNCAVAPVTFTYIKAQVSGQTGNIFWQVANQVNVRKYEVEKSTDGVHFTYLTSVSANGGSGIINYEATDPNLTNGATYYRIKEIDNDGKSEYSDQAHLIYNGSGASISLYPNPVADLLNILLPASLKVKNILVFDAVGRIVLSGSDFANSSNIATLPVGSLLPGFYKVQVTTTDNGITNLSFIKK